jgi:hypothetical protein
MPKINARENTRNRAQGKKRERNRLLRAQILGEVRTGGTDPRKVATKAKSSPIAASKA